MRKQQANIAAIYCRLSRDDGSDAESNSIGTQRAMLQRYAKENGFIVYGEYIEMKTTRLIQFNYSLPVLNRYCTLFNVQPKCTPQKGGMKIIKFEKNNNGFYHKAG